MKEAPVVYLNRKTPKRRFSRMPASRRRISTMCVFFLPVYSLAHRPSRLSSSVASLVSPSSSGSLRSSSAAKGRKEPSKSINPNEDVVLALKNSSLSTSTLSPSVSGPLLESSPSLFLVTPPSPSRIQRSFRLLAITVSFIRTVPDARAC
jgi:hypothetical protein